MPLVMCARCEVWSRKTRRELEGQGWRLRATYGSYEHTDEVWECGACGRERDERRPAIDIFRPHPPLD